MRGHTVWIGEISNEGGVLWAMEIKESNESMHMTSAELYSSNGPIGDSGSSFLIFALVFASICVAGFVAFMRYRDVSEQNGLVDRTVSFKLFILYNTIFRASNPFEHQKRHLEKTIRTTISH
jgi:hypothetical protein